MSSSLKPSRAMVLSQLQNSERVIFNVCTVTPVQEQLSISDCQIMGKAEGYEISEIENQIQFLEKKDHNRKVLKTAYLVLGTAIGAVSGAVISQAIATKLHPSDFYSLISYFAGGILVGGGAGLTLSIVTEKQVSDWFSPYFQKNEKALLKEAESLNDSEVSVVVLKTSLQKTVNDFQEVLLGIQ